MGFAMRWVPRANEVVLRIVFELSCTAALRPFAFFCHPFLSPTNKNRDFASWELGENLRLL